MKKIYVRIPMEERLNRIAAGYASSPQFSQVQVERFCSTPVVPALESIGGLAERQQLCDLLKEEPLKSLYHRKWVEDVTFGDLASMITEYYHQYGTEPSDDALPLYSAVQQLLVFYFICFDGIISIRNEVREQGRVFRRGYVNPHLQSVYDLLYVSFDDYYLYAALCDPTKNFKKIDAYRAEKGMSYHMSPMHMYEEMKMDVWIFDGYHFDTTELPSLDQCKNLIDFFVYPIAMIAKNGPTVNRIINEKISKGVNENEKGQ